jgi:hypothetical protein
VTAVADRSLLGRVERRSLWMGALATGSALVVPGGGVWVAAGVLGGWLLAVSSYLAIKRGVGALADRVTAKATVADPVPPTGAGTPAGGSGQPRGLVMFVLRHALLAGMAYVMIARLRLPPVALLVGASVIVLAVAAEVLQGPRPH